MRIQGRDPEPSAAIIDSQPVKATRTAGTRDDDAGKKINGTKRHLLVDALGLLIVVVVYSAAIQDRDGAKLVCRKPPTRRASNRFGPMAATRDSWWNGRGKIAAGSWRLSNAATTSRASSCCLGAGSMSWSKL
ncbi:MAG: transposase [Pirellulales bacterium]|nr:transposase [Pirellulales bacterium]